MVKVLENNGIYRSGQEGKRGIKGSREHGTPVVLEDIILCSRQYHIGMKCNLIAIGKRDLGSQAIRNQ